MHLRLGRKLLLISLDSEPIDDKEFIVLYEEYTQHNTFDFAAGITKHFAQKTNTQLSVRRTRS